MEIMKRSTEKKDGVYYGTLVMSKLLLKMAIEIVDFPIKNGDFPVRYVKLPEGNPTFGLLLVAQTSEKGPMVQQFGW